MTGDEQPEQALVHLSYTPPGEPLLLHEGQVALLRDGREPALTTGRVVLRWREGASLLWSAALRPDWGDQRAWRVTGSGDLQLSLQWRGLPVLAPTALTETGRGWLNEVTFGDAQAPIHQVVACWVNMPTTWPRTFVRGDGQSWLGRWTFEAGEWELCFDARPDVGEVAATCKRERLNAVTHTIQLRRADRQPFTGVRAAAVLDALHLAVSFAAGRWTCPAAPLGLDAAGKAVWGQWAPSHCDHPGKGSNGWWVQHHEQDLVVLIEHFLRECQQPDRWLPLQYLASAAILAGESGFVEQRLTTAAAALEHLIWISDVLEGDYTPDNFRLGARRHAHKRLRQHLTRLQVPLEVDPSRSPALAAYAAGADGPRTVLQVRNRLAHPEDTAQTAELYAQTGLIAEAARLTCRYLDLAVLHRIGYVGAARDRTKVTGWSGEAELVPWAPDAPGGA